MSILTICNENTNSRNSATEQLFFEMSEQSDSEIFFDERKVNAVKILGDKYFYL